MRHTESPDTGPATADAAPASGQPGTRRGSRQEDRALGDFLRALRGRADAALLGVPDDGRARRVPGLRREELAELAHVSVDYVARIEQGRKRRVSRAVLTALADALELGPDERQHLFVVAGVTISAAACTGPDENEVPSNVRQLLHSLDTLPALVLNRRMDVLAWNRAAAGLLADFGSLRAGERNLVRLAFLDPYYRALFGDGWEAMARESVAALRMEAGRRPEDMALQSLVGELSVRDAKFRTWWATQAVSSPKARRKTYRHPVAGPLTLDAQLYSVEGRPELHLVSYTAQEGSPSAEALRFLVQWSHDTRGSA